MVQQHTAAKQVNVKRRSVIVKAVVVIQVEVVVVVWWRRPPWPSWSFGTKMKKNKKRRPTKAKGGSTVWKCLKSHEMLDVENSMNFHSMWGRPLQAFFVSSFFFCFSSKKEEATKRDPVVLLLHDLMLNAHANSNITRTQTLCPGLSGLNQPSEIDGPRSWVGISSET